MAEQRTIEEMSIEELEYYIQDLGRQKDEIRMEQRRATEVLDIRIAQRNAQITLETMSDIERAALAQVIGVNFASAGAKANGGQ